jgi:hypothetical protein
VLQNAYFAQTRGLASASVDAATVYNQWTKFPADFDPTTAGLALVISPAGDLDADDVLAGEDIDLLAIKIGGRAIPTWWLPDAAFDLNGDSRIDLDDHRVWVKELRHTWFGDANLDFEFNSGDLIQVLSAGKYDAAAEYDFFDDLINPASWSEGDWNADGLFNSTDLVDSLADGGYEQGPRRPAAAVPEPSGLLLVAGLLPLLSSLARRGAAVHGLPV